jgi:D-alanyl-D-alanine endopeptidase (penicillin-binding protein 7)
LAVIKSNNAAADTLCKHYPGGYSECIKAMNAKAQDLGLIDTKFVDATGLGVMNISKATELIKIVIEAQKYPEIVEDSRTPYFHIRTKNTKLGFNNTNPIVSKRQDFVVSKTGYIRASGGCIVMMVDTAIGKRIIVLLGSKNTKTRIPEAEFIAKRH